MANCNAMCSQPGRSAGFPESYLKLPNAVVVAVRSSFALLFWSWRGELLG